MITYRDIAVGLEKMGLDRSTPVLAHMAPARLGEIRGGAETLLGAILGTIDNVMMPAFTFSTMVVPQVGPADNFMDYGGSQAGNLDASIFTRNLPGDQPNAEMSELLRNYPGSYRSSHPLLSFVGLGLNVALIDQTPQDPYAPIRKLMEMNGWVALIGAEPADNISLHYAEFLAGRKQFVRWALTEDGILECPHFPGCPDGFHKINYYLQDEMRISVVGDSHWSAVPLEVLINSAVALIRDDPFALLCNSLSCPRCNLVRKAIKEQISGNWHPEA